MYVLSSKEAYVVQLKETRHSSAGADAVVWPLSCHHQAPFISVAEQGLKTFPWKIYLTTTAWHSNNSAANVNDSEGEKTKRGSLCRQFIPESAPLKGGAVTSAIKIMQREISECKHITCNEGEFK